VLDYGYMLSDGLFFCLAGFAIRDTAREQGWGRLAAAGALSLVATQNSSRAGALMPVPDAAEAKETCVGVVTSVCAPDASSRRFYEHNGWRKASTPAAPHAWLELPMLEYRRAVDRVLAEGDDPLLR
jgi:hypothetical protein